MRYLTGHYYCANPHTALVLQQVSRIRDKLPIMLACVWERAGEGDKSVSAAETFVEKITQWFDKEALSACAMRDERRCVEGAYKTFLKAFDGNGDAFAALFCAGRECFYAWRGATEIHLLNLAFNRLHRRKLTFAAEEMHIQRARLDIGVGILLGTEAFFTGMPEVLMKECLAVASLENGGQVERHLKEAAREAERKGAAHPTAVLTVTREVEHGK